MHSNSKACRFVVSDLLEEIDSVLLISSKMIENLNIFQNDVVRITGNKRRQMICHVLIDNITEYDKICLSHNICRNIQVQLGEKITLDQCPDIKNATRVQVLPFSDTINELTENLFECYLEPYFKNRETPVKEGNTFCVKKGSKTVEFKVHEVDPAPKSIVNSLTEIYFEGEPFERVDEEHNSAVGYDDVGGMHKQLTLLREFVDLPLRHPQLFKTIGVKPPTGVLLYGPPGSGKTLIARAVANETSAYFFVLNGPEIMSKLAGESENNLRIAFKECEMNSPSILFIDEIDSIAPKREKNTRRA